MKRNSPIALAAGALFLASSTVAAHAYSSLYVFGDSLSDAGNVYLATTAPGSPFPPQPVAPYVNGQFSNGPIWVEDLSARLGLGPVLPALAGGTDYAFGGATTGYPATLSSTLPVPTLAQQVGLFLSAVSGLAPPSALYTVWAGSNDLLNIIGNGKRPHRVAGSAGRGAGRGHDHRRARRPRREAFSRAAGERSGQDPCPRRAWCGGSGNDAGRDLRRRPGSRSRWPEVDTWHRPVFPRYIFPA